MSILAEKLKELATAGFSGSTEAYHSAWRGRVYYFLEQAMGRETADNFRQISDLHSEIGMLEGIAARLEAQETTEKKDSEPAPQKSIT